MFISMAELMQTLILTLRMCHCNMGRLKLALDHINLWLGRQQMSQGLNDMQIILGLGKTQSAEKKRSPVKYKQ